MKKKKSKIMYSVESFGCPSCGSCHKNTPASSAASVASGNTSASSTATNCP